MRDHFEDRVLEVMAEGYKKIQDILDQGCTHPIKKSPLNKSIDERKAFLARVILNATIETKNRNRLSTLEGIKADLNHYKQIYIEDRDWYLAENAKYDCPLLERLTVTYHGDIEHLVYDSSFVMLDSYNTMHMTRNQDKLCTCCLILLDRLL